MTNALSNSPALVALCLLALAGTAVCAQEAPPEPGDYRVLDYRTATPLTLKGARVVTTAEAHELWLAHAAFVDVLPQAPRPANLPASTVWRDKPRFDIPGSIWLPDTGYGQLPTLTEDYFESGLEKISGRDKTKPVVIYCLTSCWMSWNAARRAISYGYSQVVWFPDGTDGWDASGYPLEPRKPEPR